MFKQTGKRPAQLDAVQIPEWLIYLWQWFVELHNTRGEGMSGVAPITYSEMKAWSELTGNEPTPWEVRAIKAVDRIACRPKEK